MPRSGGWAEEGQAFWSALGLDRAQVHRGPRVSGWMTGLGLALRDVARSLVTALPVESERCVFERANEPAPGCRRPRGNRPRPSSLRISRSISRTIASAINRDSGAAQRAEMEHDGMRQRALSATSPLSANPARGSGNDIGLTGLSACSSLISEDRTTQLAPRDRRR